MTLNIADVIGTTDLGKLIDLKFSINDNGKPEPESILVQAQKIIAAYGAGQTLSYGDH
jgi:hypothetical protein